MLIDTIRECIPVHLRSRMILRETNADIVAGIRGVNNHSLMLLIYNPDKLRQMSTTHPLKNIVWHELFHYIFGHVYEPVVSDRAYLTKRNIAMDCQINSYIYWTPEQLKSIAHPLNWDLPVKLSWREYMDLLPDDPQPTTDTVCSIDTDCGDEVTRVAKDIAREEGYRLDSTSAMPIKTAARGKARNVMSQITRVLEEEVGYYSRYPSMTRPHKVKGLGYAGKKKATQPKVLVALDASGSITTEQHSTFMTTVRRIMSEIRPLIIEFDDRIRHTGKGLSGKYWGGGTNFSLVQQFAASRGYDTIVWFTDCEGEFIEDDIYHIVCNIGGRSDARPVRHTNITLDDKD